MVNVRQNNSSTVNIHVQNSSSQTSTSNIRMYDNTDFLAAGLAKDWAIRTDGKVENIDYSSKYYAQRAKQSENLTKEYMEETISAIEARVPVATASVLGGIKVGSNLSVTSDGILSGLLTAAWGNISGAISAQADLQSALNLKTDLDLGNISSEGFDKVIQSKALKTGDLSNNSSVLSWLNEIKHSTFDLSKFTVIGSPTIADDGIVSGFSDSNYIVTSLTFTPANSLKYTCGFTTGNDITTVQTVWRFYNNLTGTYITNAVQVRGGKIRLQYADASYDEGYTCAANTTYYVELEFTLTSTIGKIYKNGVLDYTNTYAATTLMRGNNSNINIGVNTPSTYTQNFLGTINLKQFSITVDGVEVFSGNQTGIDTYSINGSTVTIPYTLSKTGSKIVDSAYRTQVASVYDYQGYAPYYTLSDTDFTLPQGELYGMIERNLNTDYPTQKEKNTIIGWGIPDYANGITITPSDLTYTAPSDGYLYIEVWGGTAGNLSNLKINNVSVLDSPTTSDGEYRNTFGYLVGKGDVITWTYVSVYMSFYPLKGAQ